MAVDHYENFPVASWLVPAGLRGAVREIYRFARHADDVADEGDAAPAQRLAELAALRTELERIGAGAYPGDGPWAALAREVARHRLPLAPLHDLLGAFERDARGMQVEDYEQLFAYCRLSANPVGRLMLALYRRDEAGLHAWSDAICTGLQLVNFWQDIERDFAKGRIYLPRSELARYGVDPAQIGERRIDASWVRLLRAQTQVARELLLRGRPLAPALGGRLGWELRLVIQGGLRIAERIDAVGGDVFARRPVLGAGDWARLCLRAAVMA